MTGMLLKDWYCLWDMLKRIVLLLGVVYPFLAITTDMPYLALMMPLLLAYYSLSSIAMDDKCQWSRYARTLPVSVQAQVGAKYLLAVLSSGIGLVWCLATGGLHCLVKPHTVDWVGDYLLSGIVCCGTALLVMAVLLPVAFKKGVEKARNWMIVLWLALFGGFYLLAKLVPTATMTRTMQKWLDSIPAGYAAVLGGIGGVILVAGALWGSYRASCKIYAGKEL